MDDLFLALVLISLLISIVSSVVFVIKWITKKDKKKYGIVAITFFVLFWVIGILWGMMSCKHDWNEESRINPTCDSDGEITYRCSLCDNTKSESIESPGHSMKIVSQLEPTETLDGEIVRQCTLCGFEEIEKIDKLSPKQNTADNTPSQPSQLPQMTNTEMVDTSVDFEEIYREYKENELRANDKYKNNRYRITATINGMSSGGLFNITGGATLTMETRIDNTIVFFYAEFEKEQEEVLKTVNVGDTVTFEGECLSAGTWVECELID